MAHDTLIYQKSCQVYWQRDVLLRFHQSPRVSDSMDKPPLDPESPRK